jgi:hypothetical protein
VGPIAGHPTRTPHAPHTHPRVSALLQTDTMELDTDAAGGQPDRQPLRPPGVPPFPGSNNPFDALMEVDEESPEVVPHRCTPTSPAAARLH